MTLLPAADGGPMPRPSGSPQEEVRRILAATCHYNVLEVDSGATEDTIKRARRMKSLLVHPDKVGSDVAGANDAFGKVTLVSFCCTATDKSELLISVAVCQKKVWHATSPQKSDSAVCLSICVSVLKASAAPTA